MSRAHVIAANTTLNAIINSATDKDWFSLLGNFNGMLTNYVPESIIKSISSPIDDVLNMPHDVFIQNKFMTLFSICLVMTLANNGKNKCTYH